MRLLHPRTIEILASHPEFPKTHLAHCWSEIFKWKASGKSHPKQFIDDDFELGEYLFHLWYNGNSAGCTLDDKKIETLNDDIQAGWKSEITNRNTLYSVYFSTHFDDNYLFSDAVSLYFKGTNIFPDIFGDEWRKYVPVESLKEIKRQVDKTLSK